jgi:proteasome-associated ATPase
MSDRSMRRRSAACVRTIAALEAEVAVLRRRLRTPPGVNELENPAETRQHLDRVLEQNDKLASVLEEAREQLSVLRAEVEKLTSPPNNFGTVLRVNADGTVDVVTGNRKLRVAAQPTIEVKELSVGQEVLLNESFTIVDVRGFDDRRGGPGP